MEAEAKRKYPIIMGRVWRDLRRQFQSTWPRGAVDAGYLSDVLTIDERTARNIVPNLKRVGLIDENNRATDLAQAWRDDERYREVTERILATAYPTKLLDVAPPPNPDPALVQRWFAREALAGPAYARQLTRFYVLLASGDPNVADDATARPQRGERESPKEARAPRRTAADAVTKVAERRQSEREDLSSPPPPAMPSVHIDVQVHIDPAASAEQIDQIFASMARHFYGRG